MELKYGQECVIIQESYGNQLWLFKGTLLDKAREGNVYTVINTPSNRRCVEEQYIYDLETAKKVVAEWLEKGGKIYGEL